MTQNNAVQPDAASRASLSAATVINPAVAAKNGYPPNTTAEDIEAAKTIMMMFYGPNWEAFVPVPENILRPAEQPDQPASSASESVDLLVSMDRATPAVTVPVSAPAAPITPTSVSAPVAPVSPVGEGTATPTESSTTNDTVDNGSTMEDTEDSSVATEQLTKRSNKRGNPSTDAPSDRPVKKRLGTTRRLGAGKEKEKKYRNDFLALLRADDQ